VTCRCFPSLGLARHRIKVQYALQVSIDGHPIDSDVNLETFVLFLSRTPARFYLSVELGFIVCFLHFMHICHARHYSTLRNVHYWKRRRRRNISVHIQSVKVYVFCQSVSGNCGIARLRRTGTGRVEFLDVPHHLRFTLPPTIRFTASLYQTGSNKPNDT